MSYSKTGALNKYTTASVQADVTYASPHRLIQMLLEGALEKVAMARGYMERGQVPAKGQHIGWAISIIDGLRASLDMNAGGEIAQNLYDLYDYMGRRLLHANLNNDPDALEEVIGLLRQIKSAWDAISDDTQNGHARTKSGAATLATSAAAVR